MRKISESYYYWLVTTNRRLWSKQGGRNKKPYKRQGSPRNAVRTYPLLLPSALSLESVEDFDALVQVVSELRHRIRYPKFAPIDFRPIQTITPSGALILAAEIDRLRRKRQMKLRPWFESEWQPAVKKIFLQFKLYNLLNISRKDEDHEFEHTKFVPLIYGRRAQGERATALRENLEKIIGEPLEKKHWYVALTEAMTNVAQHAYPEPQKDIDISQAWWLSGSFDELTGLLTVMFYDQGITIPGSLPQSKIWLIRF